MYDSNSLTSSTSLRESLRKYHTQRLSISKIIPTKRFSSIDLVGVRACLLASYAAGDTEGDDGEYESGCSSPGDPLNTRLISFITQNLQRGIRTSPFP